MKLFVSHFVNKIDKKGRISFPSLFRNALPKTNKNEIILYKSLKHNSVEGCSVQRIEEIAKNQKKFVEKKENESSLIEDMIAFDYKATIDGKNFTGGEGKILKLF